MCDELRPIKSGFDLCITICSLNLRTEDPKSLIFIAVSRLLELCSSIG